MHQISAVMDFFTAQLQGLNVSAAAMVAAMLALLVLPIDLSQLFLMVAGAALASLAHPAPDEQRKNVKCGSADTCKAMPVKGKTVGGCSENHQGFAVAVPTGTSNTIGEKAESALSSWKSVEPITSSERKPLRLKPRTLPCRSVSSLLQSPTSLRPGGMLAPKLSHVK